MPKLELGTIDDPEFSLDIGSNDELEFVDDSDTVLATLDQSGTLSIDQLDVSNNTFVRAHLSSDQSYLTANGLVTVQFDTADADRRSEFDAANNTVTVDKAGIYLIAVNVQFGVASAGDGLNLRINAGGTPVVENIIQAGDSGLTTVTGSNSTALSAGDDIEILAANLNNDDTIQSGERFTNFSVVRVA